ncbi:hypothetical protein H8356DRAFT_1350995 [Neocallimastix lanati (nom. inval.)]|nr:hypothetical protein H8356DRAFT_1350995 [Neocallimastix sp. JGI-2020a]
MPHSRIKSVNIKEEEYYHEEKINLARNWDFSVISINKQILMNNAIIAIKIGILLITITILSTRIINNPNPSKCFLNYPIHQRITIKMKRKIIIHYSTAISNITSNIIEGNYINNLMSSTNIKVNKVKVKILMIKKDNKKSRIIKKALLNIEEVSKRGITYPNIPFYRIYKKGNGFKLVIEIVVIVRLVNSRKNSFNKINNKGMLPLHIVHIVTLFSGLKQA